MRKSTFSLFVMSVVIASARIGSAAPPGDAATTSPAKSALPRLVDLGAEKCVPCRMMAPVLKELKADYEGQLEVIFIDVWKNRQAGVEYGIRAIPTQIFYNAQGKELERHEGFISREDIIATFKKHAVTFRPPAKPLKKSSNGGQTQ
ncbi:MAG: thioredoxin family protein [Candidatus Sumerlaeia bacterium]